MIGLGSNRLTVCRRGGMSVTQAGRGGMEWLAGVRVPSWARPYSAQATAALLAQFPTQWPTIRDYGFAHPEIVGYMNAYAPEDAKIAYSLVPNVGRRTIQSDGVAYIYTDISAVNGMTWECVGKIGDYKGEFTTLLGFQRSDSNWGFPLLCYRDESIRLQAHTNAAYIRDNSQDWKADFHKYEIKADGYLYIDGVRKGTNNTNTYQAGNIALFRNSMRTVISKSLFVSFEGTTNSAHRIYPFIRNGAKGIIDIETNKFYGNSASSGTLTISETPAS